MRYVSYISFALSCLLLASCVPTVTGPMARPCFRPGLETNFNSPKAAFLAAVETLRGEGYEVSANTVLLEATTAPNDVGHQVWRTTGETWRVSYQLELLVIRINNGKFHWCLRTAVLGTRSGRQDRAFDSTDFDVVNRKVQKIEGLLTKKLSE